MNVFLITAALGLVFALSANAADQKPPSRIATCNQEAGDRKDSARKAFTKKCVRAKMESPRQSKMASCNVEAKGLKGYDREKSMSDCVSK